MLSALILTLNDAEALTKLFTALVPAAVDGLVVEVIVCDGGSTDATLEIAHDCGATVTDEAAVDEVVEAARGDWLLVLPVRARLPQNWMEIVVRHCAGDRAGPAQLRGPRRGWFFGRGQPTGWLIPKSMAEALDLASGGQGGLGHLAGRRVQRLELFARD